MYVEKETLEYTVKKYLSPEGTQLGQFSRIHLPIPNAQDSWESYSLVI